MLGPRGREAKSGPFCWRGSGQSPVAPQPVTVTVPSKSFRTVAWGSSSSFLETSLESVSSAVSHLLSHEKSLCLNLLE